MSSSRSALIAIVVTVLLAPCAFAQGASTGQAGDVFRIKRDYSPRLFGAVETNKFVPAKQVYIPQNASPDSAVQANDYAGVVSSSAMPVIPPVIPIPTVVKPKASYVWGQSAAGGYYDCSGKMQGTVMGDQLFKFGGTFSDGTPVPTTPVVCNFRGHVYKPYVVKRLP